MKQVADEERVTLSRVIREIFCERITETNLSALNEPHDGSRGKLFRNRTELINGLRFFLSTSAKP